MASDFYVVYYSFLKYFRMVIIYLFVNSMFLEGITDIDPFQVPVVISSPNSPYPETYLKSVGKYHEIRDTGKV